MKLTLKHLRRHAITASLFRPTTLRRAIDRLGFVQADPIRSPARAQDLILRHRVKDYRVGDLDSLYPPLDIEEDFLYAYGFMPQSTCQMLHPRFERKLTVSEQQVLNVISAHKRIHPRELERYFGQELEINAWGGYSKVTTQALQALHYQGLLRVSGREDGIRLYTPTIGQPQQMDPDERLRKLVLLIATIFAPVPDLSLFRILQHLAYVAPALERRRSSVAKLVESGSLESIVVDKVRYLWPAGKLTRKTPAQTVRFLAPFDPLVWDRRRFEHFWGWPYRLEAYTPLLKRKLGYYAMPMLWQDDVIGWVNITDRKGELSLEQGFSKGRPTEPTFQKEFDEEVERFRRFLRKRENAL